MTQPLLAVPAHHKLHPNPTSLRCVKRVSNRSEVRLRYWQARKAEHLCRRREPPGFYGFFPSPEGNAFPDSRSNRLSCFGIQAASEPQSNPFMACVSRLARSGIYRLDNLPILIKTEDSLFVFLHNIAFQLPSDSGTVCSVKSPIGETSRRIQFRISAG